MARHSGGGTLGFLESTPQPGFSLAGLQPRKSSGAKYRRRSSPRCREPIEGVISACVSDPFLRARFRFRCRLCRQLEHCRFLPLAQEGKKKRVTVRQLETVMVHARLFETDLTEDCSLLPCGLGRTVTGDLALEGKLNPGLDANRDGRIVCGRKTA